VGILRTSRSLLMDRTVRVERRLPLSDGIGGTVADFVTIIDRYWLTIMPTQHQARDREELGEVADQTHFGMADPSRNGRTIMVGDRFVDEINNECYLVRGVIRPPKIVGAYNAMHRFELTIVKDWCPKAQAQS
jgi:hypothetical protein